MFEGLLNKRGDIYRPTLDAATGPEAKPAWGDALYSDVSCRISNKQAKELDKETGAVVWITTGFFPFGTDIVEYDRLVVDDVRYDVQGVNSDAGGAGHHVEVVLKAVV